MSEADRSESAAEIRVGHWSDHAAQTGCTVVLFPRALLTVVDQRGGAPGTRETDLLRDGNMVRRADAILMSGGSAFGLAAADGVMGALREQGRGFPTVAGPVPIVPSAVLFDLSVGQPVWPRRAAGRAALADARPVAEVRHGRIGAGTGATVGKITGRPRPGGFGIHSINVPGGRVTAIVVVNAFGSIGGPDPRRSLLNLGGGRSVGRVGENTTIASVVIEASVDSTALHRCAIAAHDAYARVIVPCHTIFDGDTVFVSGTTEGAPRPEEIMALAMATELSVEEAIRDAIRDHD